jgi:nucleotidyltransferase-like protein
VPDAKKLHYRWRIATLRSALDRVNSRRARRRQPGIRAVKRERAVHLVDELLQRLDAQRDEWPVSLVTEVYVFGSFARGALIPHDVDLAVEIRPDARWGKHMSSSIRFGRNPFTPIKRALAGSGRSIHFLFAGVAGYDFPFTLLWRRGEPIATAYRRLHAIQPDPTATKGPRIEGPAELGDLAPRFNVRARSNLQRAVQSGSICVERLELPAASVRNARAAEHLSHRWKATSPLYRAGHAVLAHFEDRGLDPGRVHLHGRDVEYGSTPYFAGFALRFFDTVPQHVGKDGGIEWIEIPHLTRAGTFVAVRISLLDSEKFNDSIWS